MCFKTKKKDKDIVSTIQRCIEVHVPTKSNELG